VDKVIEKEEQTIQRLQIDAISEHKQSLVTDMVAKQEKVTELQRGKVIPLNALLVVRLWHRKPDQLAARCASLKNAFIAMGGAVVHHATVPENARQLFYQTWPGWTFGNYRAFDLPAEDSYLADLIPWSATFTGHLEGDSKRGVASIQKTEETCILRDSKRGSRLYKRQKKLVFCATAKGGSRLYKRQKKLVFCPTTERLEVFATMRVDFLMCVIGSDARGLLTQYSRFRDSKHHTMLLEVEPGCPSHEDDNAVSWQEHDGTEVR
jgi:hypothetical protein